MHILVIGAAGMVGAKLITRLCAEGNLNGRPIARLSRFDVVIAPPPPDAAFSIDTHAGDLSIPGEAEKLVANRPDVIFHLAAIVSGEAEADFDKGYRINLDGTRYLFDAIRKVGGGYRPRVVFTSSIAVFGAPFPEAIGDEFFTTPLTSYGTQKAIAELLLSDYSRRGFFDGVGLRLPTICVRPGKPNLAASGFFSGIIREPLSGKEAILPVSEEVRHSHASPRSAIGFLLHGAALDTEALGARRNITLPGVSCTVSEQIAALRRVAGDRIAGLIRREPNETVMKIVSGWPRKFDPKRALALGFKSETSFDDIIRVHIEDELGGRIPRMTRTAAPEILRTFTLEFLTAAGADSASAEAATRALMHASLHGVDSHGVRLLPWYADCLRTGLVKGSPRITVTYPSRAAALVDAGHGMGHVATYRAMEEACRLARECGIGMAGVINSSHFGAAGAYALAAAEAGFIGFVTGNSGAFVIPHGGTKSIHGTNPIAIAAPNANGHHFLLDMATSAIPWNRVLKFRTEGLELPGEVAVNEAGAFVTDPHLAVALAPVGGANYGYKGAGLAGLAEILGAVLTGMRLSIDRDRTELADKDMGHFVMAIDPAVFISAEYFAARLSAYLGSFGEQPGTYPAGGPEWQRRSEREASGIPLPEGLYDELAAAAEKLGMPFGL